MVFKEQFRNKSNAIMIRTWAENIKYTKFSDRRPNWKYIDKKSEVTGTTCQIK
jgi:hypothetical protein